MVGLPFDDRFFRRQIIDIHFVDLRRNGELWRCEHLVSRGRILDKFKAFIAIHNRTLCGRNIFAKLERLFVDLAHHHIVVDHVIICVFQALHEAKAARVYKPFLCGRVTDQAVRRRHCVDDDLRNEVCAVALQRIKVEILNIAFDALLHR